MCAHFCYKMVHGGIWDWYIVGFVQQVYCFYHHALTHWGRVTHIWVGEQTIIGSDNGLSPGRRQAIIWTNAGIFSIEPLGTNFNETLIKIFTFSSKKTYLKMPSGKWWPSCLGLNELIQLTHSSLVRYPCTREMGHHYFWLLLPTWLAQK